MSDEQQITVLLDTEVVAVEQPRLDLLVEERETSVVIESTEVAIVLVPDELRVSEQVSERTIITVGEQGPPGLPGALLHILGVDGLDGEDSFVPGPQGSQGERGLRGSSGGISGRIYYFDPLDISDLAGYGTANTVPPLSAHTQLPTALTGTGDILIEEFATEPGEPGATELPPGLSMRVYHVNTGATNQVARIKTEVYRCEADGTGEILLHSDYTENFFGVSVQEIIHTTVFNATYSLTPTQRLVFKLYGARVSGPATCDLTTHYNDATELSLIVTTLQQASAGSPGLTIPGLDGQDGEDPFPIPGERGLTGADGLRIPGLDGQDGEDAFPIPGERGASAVLANFDGGAPNSIYGGITAIDAGGP